MVAEGLLLKTMLFGPLCLQVCEYVGAITRSTPNIPARLCSGATRLCKIEYVVEYNNEEFREKEEDVKMGSECECKCAINDHADDGNTTNTTIDIRSGIGAFVTQSELFFNLITMTHQ